MNRSIRRSLAAGLLLLPVSLLAQQTETRKLADFSEIRVGGSFDVELVAGGTGAVQITAADAEQITRIRTDVDGSVLRIGTRDDNWNWNWGSWNNNSGRIKLRVTVPGSLRRVTLSGSGNIYSDQIWQAQRFETNLSGSGNIRLAIKANQAEASITGSGDIDLRGSTTDLDVHISGSGNTNALSLVAENVHVRIAGSGGAEVQATNQLMTRNAGSGSVRYAGDPRTVDLQNAGSGSVRKIR